VNGAGVSTAVKNEQGLRARPRTAARGLARLAKYLAPLAIVAVVWQLLSMAGILNERTMPSPVHVFEAAVDLMLGGELFRHLAVTVYRAEVGLLLGAVFGVALGLAMAKSRLVYGVSYPIVALTYTLPKTALIPIVFLWRGVGDASSIFVVFIGTFVPIVITTYHGAESVPDTFVWSARSMGVSGGRVLWTVVFPGALPQILNGMRIAQALAFVIVISAEMVASYVGVGRFIFLYGEAGNYDYMFAAIGIVILAAFTLDQLFVFVTGRLLRWSEREGASS
jgi:ABC-type nitrate/sulfonate/bicarbonate transport system permease component